MASFTGLDSKVVFFSMLFAFLWIEVTLRVVYGLFYEKKNYLVDYGIIILNNIII